MGDAGHDRGHEAPHRRGAAAHARRRHPDPAEPRGLVAGARRRRARPTSAGLSSNGDHISPEHPFPSPHQVRKRLLRGRRGADRAAVRLPAVHRRRLGRPGRARRHQDAYWSFIPRSGSGRPDAPQPIRRDLVAGAIEGPRRRRAHAGGAHGAVRRDAAGGDRGHAPGGGRAARRAGGGHRHVRRQPQHQRLERLHRRLRVLRLRAGQALARRLPARRRGASSRRIDEAVEYGATEMCMQSGIHPDWSLRGLPRLAAPREGRPRPQLHLHAYSPMEVAHICDVSGLAPSEVFAQLREAGLGSTPGTAAEVLHDGVRQRISPNKLPVARWVEVIEASHRAGLRSTATVMFGHIEEPWELAEHMRVVRSLQERTGGFTEFVPLSFIPFHTLLGPDARGRGDLPRGEPQAHGRVPARARQDRPEPAGVLGEDGPGGGDRGAALGRQRPRRHADGGVDQPPGRLLPRRAAWTRPS